jgi:hypothetical protein
MLGHLRVYVIFFPRAPPQDCFEPSIRSNVKFTGKVMRRVSTLGCAEGPSIGYVKGSELRTAQHIDALLTESGIGSLKYALVILKPFRIL